VQRVSNNTTIDESGNAIDDGTIIILHAYLYDAFGNELLSNANSDGDISGRTNPNPWRFNGEYWDSETQTYYLRARHFNPRTGRFTQPDPHWGIHNMQSDAASIIQSGNLYMFTMHNPVRWRDPSGRFAILSTIANTISNALSSLSSGYSSGTSSGSSSGASSSSSSGSSPQMPGAMVGASTGVFATPGPWTDLGQGWRVRIERHGDGPGYQRHAHVTNGRITWVQNEDGSPHDKGGNPPGNPPRRVLDRLNDKKGWDWRQKQDDWANKIVVSPMNEIGSHLVTFPDNSMAYWQPMPGFSHTLFPAPDRNTMLELYRDSQSPQVAWPAPDSGLTPFPIMVPSAPNSVTVPPVRIPTPIRIPIPLRIFR